MDNIFELKLENNRLKNELQFANSFIELLEDFRSLITVCVESCYNCRNNEEVYGKFQYLEKSYAKHQELAKNKEINNKVNNVPKRGNSFLTQPLSYLSVPHIAQTVVNSSALMTPEVVYSSGDDSDSDYDYGEDSSDGEIKPQIQPIRANPQPRSRSTVQTTPGEPVPCSWPGCEKTFATKKKLYKHVSVHNPKKRLKCDMCDFTHRHSNGLIAHKNKVHLNVRPFKCDKCDKDFTSKKNRDKHKASVHRSDQNMHSCDWVGCDFQTKYVQNLTIHMKRHTGEKEFKCCWPGCDKLFINNNILNVHMKIHQKPERNLHCDWPGCDMAFWRRDAWIRHRRLHDPSSYKQCEWPGCSAKFVRNDKLRKHMETHTKFT